MKPARAVLGPTPSVETPARTNSATTSKRTTSARARGIAKPIIATPARANEITTSEARSPARDQLLEQVRLLGRTLDDLERVRIMNGNRSAAYERDFGAAMPHHDVLQGDLRALEHRAVLELVRAWRKHPLAPWAKTVRGVGEKSIARLIAETGDPGERPNPGKLLAYCGHGEPLRRHHKGMSQDELFRCGNPRAKKQVYLIAVAMLKSGNRELYDARRATTAVTHPDWTPGHSHADALRIVGKRFLVDLWVEARAGHSAVDTQRSSARAGHPCTDIRTSYARAGHSRGDAQLAAARAGDNHQTGGN